MFTFKKFIFKFGRKHKPYFHFSWRLFSGMLMLVVCLAGGIFLFDPSLFSANLVADRVWESDQSEFLENSNKFAGLLPNSPLFKLHDLFGSTHKTSSNHLLVLFSKVIKASQKDHLIAETLYNEFLDKTEEIDYLQKQVLLMNISTKLKSLPITEETFKYSFDLASLLNEEDYWVNQLVLYMENKGDRKIIESRAETVFTVLNLQSNWQTKLLEQDLVMDLKLIKQYLQTPEIREDEVFHATEEAWMTDNKVWRSL
jgi:hypothetical protein